MATTKLKNGQLPDTISSKIIDNTNDISTTTTKLKISGGTNGQVLTTDGASNLSWATAGGGGLGAPIAVVTKTADESVTSSTTLQDDDHLTYSLDANKHYYIELVLLWSRTNTSAFVDTARFAMSGNSAGTLRRVQNAASVVTDGSSSLTSGAAGMGTGTTSNVFYDPAIAVFRTTTGTTITFRWAQVTSSSTGSTLRKGSCMKIYDLGAI